MYSIHSPIYSPRRGQSMALSQDNCNDCVVLDLLSPRSSWEQGWHVSVVAVTIKRSPSWMGTSPQGTIATAVKMSNAGSQVLQPEEFQKLDCRASSFLCFLFHFDLTKAEMFSFPFRERVRQKLKKRGCKIWNYVGCLFRIQPIWSSITPS